MYSSRAEGRLAIVGFWERKKEKYFPIIPGEESDISIGDENREEKWDEREIIGQRKFDRALRESNRRRNFVSYR